MPPGILRINASEDETSEPQRPKHLGSQKDLSSVIVVMAGADEAATLQFLAPYTGATLAEYFMLQGEAT